MIGWQTLFISWLPDTRVCNPWQQTVRLTGATYPFFKNAGQGHLTDQLLTTFSVMFKVHCHRSDCRQSFLDNRFTPHSLFVYPYFYLGSTSPGLLYIVTIQTPVVFLKICSCVSFTYIDPGIAMATYAFPVISAAKSKLIPLDPLLLLKQNHIKHPLLFLQKVPYSCSPFSVFQPVYVFV